MPVVSDWDFRAITEDSAHLCECIGCSTQAQGVRDEGDDEHNHYADEAVVLTRNRLESAEAH